MSLTIRSRKAPMDPSTIFWTKVQRIFGEIPNLIRMLLEFNGFDSFLALKGIQWDDKNFFFQALEESIVGLVELDENDPLKIRFREELRLNSQSMDKFRLKLGHKNLIINLCHELQKTNIDDFNAQYTTTIQVPDVKRSLASTELVVRKQQGEEHGYSREEEYEEDYQDHQQQQQEHHHHQEEEDSNPSPPPHKRVKLNSVNDSQEDEPQETTTQIQYVYEDEDGNQFIDQEYIDDDGEIVEYQEVTEDVNGIYTAEQIAKSEADQFEHSGDDCYEVGSFSTGSLKTEKSKKPIHMYTDEFLQMQVASGRIGTPGRRRPKIQKSYPDTEEGLLERWADLVRQSCEVIVPNDLLSQYDLSQIEIIKILANIWEVRCPMCTKKLRLQLTHEGKYVNFKRSNFERHLRIVHYKQIQVFKPEGEEQELLEEVHTD